MKLTTLFVASALFIAPFIGFANRAQAAGSDAKNFQVKAAVVANCVISAADINFGNYDPLSSTALTSNGQVTVQCTKGASISIGLSGGANLSSPFNQMKSSSTGSNLQYQLFQDSGMTTQWSDSAPAGSGSLMSLAVSTLSPTSYTIYGKIPAGQAASVAGDYVDTVTATVNF